MTAWSLPFIRMVRRTRRRSWSTTLGVTNRLGMGFANATVSCAVSATCVLPPKPSKVTTLTGEAVCWAHFHFRSSPDLARAARQAQSPKQFQPSPITIPDSRRPAAVHSLCQPMTSREHRQGLLPGRSLGFPSSAALAVAAPAPHCPAPRTPARLLQPFTPPAAMPMATTRRPLPSPASAGSSWQDLPSELLGLVLSRLPSHADRVRLPAVCRPWRSSARLQRPLPPLLPWLALTDGAVHRLPVADDDTG